jgi:cytochrome c5
MALQRAVLTVLALVALAGCGRKAPQEDAAKVAARAASMMPADARLAGLYQASCQNCHGHPESGAPPTGYHFAWDPRWEKGMDALLAHAIGGFQGMPAGGQCFSCAPGDYRALIRFMAGQPDGAGEGS